MQLRICDHERKLMQKRLGTGSEQKFSRFEGSDLKHLAAHHHFFAHWGSLGVIPFAQGSWWTFRAQSSLRLNGTPSAHAALTGISTRWQHAPT